MTTVADLSFALPEIILAAGSMVLLMIGAFGGERSTGMVTWLSVALLGVALIAVHANGQDGTAFGGAFVLDAFAVFIKSVILVGSAVTLIMSIGYLRTIGVERFEYPVLIVLATLGMIMMVSAGDLIALFIGLELQSLALYVVAAIRRDSLKSTEAGLKYFVLGALSSGMLLYGSSLIYGFTGTVSFPGIAEAATGDSPSVGILFGLAFIAAGLAFKVSAVPFHMWTPDVYEGAPTPVTAFFAAAPKVAAMALFTRVMVQAFPQITEQWQQIIVFIAIASMVLGAFAAIGQRNIKRMLAYSSIGHMGYALVGLAAGNEEGVQGVIHLHDDLSGDDHRNLRLRSGDAEGRRSCRGNLRPRRSCAQSADDGLPARDPHVLAGRDPADGGFFAKFYVFLAAIKAELYALAVIGVVASVVGAYYYLRIVKIMYFDESEEAFEPLPRDLGVIMTVSGVLVLAFFVYPSPLISAAEAAAQALF